MARTCTKCGRTKAALEFYRNPRSKSGYHSWCKACVKTRHRAYSYARQLKRYKLTVDDYDQLLAAQGMGCAACGTTDPGGRGRFHVDHDHACCPGRDTCGKCIRGLLCHNCNTALGFIEGERYQLLLSYLARKR